MVETNFTDFYRPQTKFAKVMFLQVSVCPHWGGVRGFIWGGMHGFIRGACMVLLGGVHGFIQGVCGFIGGHAWFYSGGHAWFYSGGHAWFYSGGRVWLLMGGHAWLLQGGRVWLLRGGVRGCSRGGVCGCSGGGMHGFFDEIRSMSGRYASYCILIFLVIRNNCGLFVRARNRGWIDGNWRLIRLYKIIKGKIVSVS